MNVRAFICVALCSNSLSSLQTLAFKSFCSSFNSISFPFSPYTIYSFSTPLATESEVPLQYFLPPAQQLFWTLDFSWSTLSSPIHLLPRSGLPRSRDLPLCPLPHTSPLIILLCSYAAAVGVASLFCDESGFIFMKHIAILVDELKTCWIFERLHCFWKKMSDFVAEN